MCCASTLDVFLQMPAISFRGYPLRVSAASVARLREMIAKGLWGTQMKFRRISRGVTSKWFSRREGDGLPGI